NIPGKDAELSQQRQQAEIPGAVEEALYLLEKLAKVDFGAVEFGEPLRQDFFRGIEKCSKGRVRLIEIRPARLLVGQWLKVTIRIEIHVCPTRPFRAARPAGRELRPSKS